MPATSLIRFALYEQVDPVSLVVARLTGALVMALAVWRYDHGRFLRRQLGKAAT
jgi:hypothetical protein